MPEEPLTRNHSLDQLTKEAAEKPVANDPNGTLGSHPVMPPWLNPKSIKAGQKFVQRHFFVVFFTHFISLVLLLCYLPVRAVLIKTGKSHTKDLALTRYVSTLRHVKLWYEKDLVTPQGEASRDVWKVRRIHSGVSKRLHHTKGSRCSPVLEMSKSDQMEAACIVSAVNSENNNISINSSKEYKCPRLITQLDMIATQFCFMGLLTEFPEKFGISSVEDKEGLQGFVHIWATIGHLLGIEDRFNLCVGDDKERLRRYILNDILLKDLRTTGMETVVLWKALVSAMSDFIPCLSIHAALLYILNHTLELDANLVYGDATLYERLCYKFMTFMFMEGFKSSILKSIFNCLLRLAIFVVSLKLGLIKVVVSRVISNQNI